MNVFKFYKSYQRIGPNYGLPTWFIDCGFGVSYDSTELVRKMATEGLKKDDWVCIRNSIAERGIGLFTEALQFVGVRMELVCKDTDKEPSWFNNVDRWIVKWSGNGTWNLQGLRARQDLLLYEGTDIKSFIEQAKANCLKGALCKDPSSVWELVKNSNIRIYEEESKDA